MKVTIFERVSSVGPRLVRTDDGTASPVGRITESNLGDTMFPKDATDRTRVRKLSETVCDDCTVEGVYCGINDSALKISERGVGTICLKFGDAEVHISMSDSEETDAPPSPPSAA